MEVLASGGIRLDGGQAGTAGRLPTIDDVRAMAEQKGVDPSLAAAIFSQESGGNFKSPNSPKGAVGGMQVMPDTFKQMLPGGDISNPWHNLEAGILYLAHGQKKLGTNDPKILAAGYHQGYNRPELARGEIAPTSDGLIQTPAYAGAVVARMGVNPQAQPQPQQRPPTWAEVLQHPSMKDLGSDDMEKARAQYFLDVVAPTVRTAKELRAVKAAFDADTAPKSFMQDLTTAVKKSWETFKTSEQATAFLATGGDAAPLSKSIATDVAAQKEPPTYVRPLMQAVKEANDTQGFWQGLLGVGKVLYAGVTNPKATAYVTTENLANQIASLSGMIVGGVAGSAMGPAGTLGGLALGALAGNHPEAGAKLVELAVSEARKRGLDASKPADVQTILDDPTFQTEARKQGLLKWAVVGGVDALTALVGAKVLTGPQRALQAQVTKELAARGVNVADKAAVKAALEAPEIAAALRPAIERAAAASTTGQKALRTGGAFALETVGEGTGELLGEAAASGEWKPGEAALESLASIGQSAGQTVATKALTAPGAIADMVRGQAAAPEDAGAPQTPGRGPGATAAAGGITAADVLEPGAQPAAEAPATPKQAIGEMTPDVGAIFDAAKGRAPIFNTIEKAAKDLPTAKPDPAPVEAVPAEPPFDMKGAVKSLQADPNAIFAAAKGRAPIMDTIAKAAKDLPSAPTGAQLAKAGIAEPAVATPTVPETKAQPAAKPIPANRPQPMDDARLQDENVRSYLAGVAEDAGWGEKGGNLLIDEMTRDRQPGNGTVIGKTELVGPEWWQLRPADARIPGDTNGRLSREAARKALAGEPMKAVERRAVEHMLAEAQRRAELDAQAAQQSGVDALPEREQDPAYELADEVVAVYADNWQTMSEEQREAELDSIFGPVAAQGQSGETVPAGEGGGAQARPTETGPPAEEAGAVTPAASRETTPSPEGVSASGERPALDLTGQTPADLAAAAAKRAEDAAKAAEASAKEAADAARGDFTLTGSDRPADELGARGQGDLLGSDKEKDEIGPDGRRQSDRNAAELDSSVAEFAAQVRESRDAASTVLAGAKMWAKDSGLNEGKFRRALHRKWANDPSKRMRDLAAVMLGGLPQEAPQPISDVGEKIGGARKDTAEPGGTRKASQPTDEGSDPAWRKRFSVSQIIKSMRPEENGRWVIYDSRKTDFRGQPLQVGRETFPTKEAADEAVPLAAVAMKHRAVPNREGGYEIWRDVTDRKRVKVVAQEFPTREDAMRYMAQHAVEIIETKTGFGEEILPRPEKVARVGAKRREGDVAGEDFMDSFGFKGVEFGNWEAQDERQAVMNHAYDALMDLADVLGVPPKALGLNGDLALAFGARGQGLRSARAHYERDYGVINLTKMHGAGSLAHEWFHAADHYFARQDTKAASDRVKNERGDMVFAATSPEADMASHGFSRGSKVREELQAAYTRVIKTMISKAEQYVEDTQKAEKFVGRTRDDLRDILNKIRADLAEQKDPTYWKRNNKPASAEQLAQFDALADKLVQGEALETKHRMVSPAKNSRSLGTYRVTNDVVEQLSAIYKTVRGRSGFDSTNRNGTFDRLTDALRRYAERVNQLESAKASETKVRNVPTSFAMEARSIDQGRSSDYWATPHEMAARAFQSYVEDKVADRGGRSDFLTYGTNVAIPTPWGWARPFPAGEERLAINSAFDDLFRTMQSKETDKGVALLSRSGEFEAPRSDMGTNGLPRLANSSVVLGYTHLLGDPSESVSTARSGIFDPKTKRQVGEVIFDFNRETKQIEALRWVTVERQHRGKGHAEGAVRAILGYNSPDTELRVVSILAEAKSFWRRLGANFDQQAEDPDGSITRGQFAGAGRSSAPATKGGANTDSEGPAGRGSESPGPRRSQAGKVATKTPADAGVSASVARVAGELEQRMGRPADALGVKIVGTIAGLPAGLKSYVESQDATDTQGVYDPDTGTAYLVASNIAPGRAFAVYLHELGVHKGLRELLGDERMAALAKQVRAWSRGSGTIEEIRLAKIAAAKIPKGTPAAVADEELIAYFVETAVNSGHDIPESRPQRGRLAQWLHDLWKAVHTALDKLGVAPETMTAAEVVALARGAAEKAAVASAVNQTETPAFRRWFEGSKVVDKQGRPLVVYHGTKADITEFDDREVVAGFHFGSTTGQAGMRAAGEGKNIMPVYLAITNPRRSKDTGGKWAPKIKAAKADKHDGIVYLNRYEGIPSESFERAIQAVAKKRGTNPDRVRLDDLPDAQFKALVPEAQDSYIAFRPDQIKSATGNRGTFDPNDPSIVRSVFEAPFYSALLRAVRALNMNAAPAAQWIATINGMTKSGVKADEIQWSGVLDWLGTQDGKVTREAIVQYLEQNGVQVTETLLDDEGQTDLPEGWQVRRASEGYDSEYPWVLVDDDDEVRGAGETQADAMRDGWDADSAADVPTKFSQYQLPGGKNYRELLLTLPEREQTAPTGPRGWADTNSPNSAVGDVNFRSAHFDQPNIVAHVRFNERTDADGRRVLFLEELQSDWAQGIRKNGVRVEASPEEIKRLAQAAREKDDALDSAKSLYAKARGDADFWTAKLDRMEADSRTPASDLEDVRKRQSAAYEEVKVTRDALKDASLEMSAAESALHETKRPRGLPSAPFVTKTDAWVALSLKRMIRYAAENGFDAVAWTTGEQQAARYDLSKQVGSIAWRGNGNTGRTVNIDVTGRGNAEVLTNGEGKIVGTRGAGNTFMAMEGRGLDEAIGKELAQRIMEEPEGMLSGDGLKVGGSGMKSFYDKIVPTVAKDVLKKLGGGQLESFEIDVQGRFTPNEGLRVQYEYRGPSVSADDVLRFARTADNVTIERQLNEVHDRMMRGTPLADAMREEGSISAARAIGGDLIPMERVSAQQPGFVLTPELRQKAMAGQPLFSRAGTQVQQQAAARRSYGDVARAALDRVDSVMDPLHDLPNKAGYLKARYLALGKIAKVDELAKGIRETFSNATAEDRRAAYDYLTTADAEPDAIVGGLTRERAKWVKEQINYVGDQLVERGLLSEESREANRDAYLPRLYLKHLLSEQDFRALGSGRKPSDMGYLKARKDLSEETRKAILGEIEDPGFLSAVAIAKPVRDMALLDWLAEVATSKDWVLPETLVQWRGRRVSAMWLKSEAARIRRQVPVMPDAANAKRAREIADQMDQLADDAVDKLKGADLTDWRQVPDTARYGRLRGIWVRREIYDDMMGVNDFLPTDPGFFQSLLGYGGIGTKATQLWKMSKVALNPPAQVRNFVSNGVLLQLSGVPLARVPQRIIQAFREISNNGKHWQVAKKYGVTASTFSTQELYRFNRELLDLQKQEGKLSPLRQVWRIAAIVGDWASDLYQKSEAVFKTAKIIDAMERQGLSESEAAMEAQKWLFDYSLVPKEVRYLRNAPIGMPFLTFAAKVLPRLIEVATLHPMRLLPWVALSFGLPVAVAAMLGVSAGDLEKLKKALPKWLQERGHAYILPFQDSEGRWQAIDLGYFFPWTMYTQFLGDIARGEPKEALGTIGLFSGPVLDVIIALKTNEDPFTNREIVKPGDPPAAQAVSIVNYLYDLMAPPWLSSKGLVSLNVLNAPLSLFSTSVDQYLGKAYQAATGKTNKYGDPTTTGMQAAVYPFGVNLYSLEAEHTRAANLLRMKFEIDQVRQGLNKRMQDRGLSAERRQEIVDEYRSEMERRMKKIQEYARDSEVPPTLRARTGTGG